MTIIIFFILSIILYWIIPAKKQALAAVAIGLLMSVLAFYLTETNQYDLIIHRELYDTLVDGGFSAAMVYSVIDRSPLFVWLIYILSYLGDNRFTSAIPTFAGYFILVYLLIQTSKKYGIRKRVQIAFLLFLLCVLPWQDYSAGIRGALAYSLCCIGVYLEFRKQEKFLGLFFYIVPIFIHQASSIFLLMRVLIYMIKLFPSSKKIIYAFCLFAGSLVDFIAPIIDSFANMTNLRILSVISGSFESYAIRGKDIYEISIVLLRICAVLLIYFATRRQKDGDTESESHIFFMYTMLMLISIGFAWQYDIVCRYTVACMMLSSLTFYRCNKKYMLLLVVFAILNLIRYNYSYYSKWEILFQ